MVLQNVGITTQHHSPRRPRHE